MLSIAHVATGALVASKLPNPLLYVPISLACHYIEDAIIHWDAGTGMSSGKKAKSKALFHEAFDMLFTLVFVLLVFELPQPGIQWHIWIASGIALLPDFMEAPENFLNFSPKILKPFNSFHDKFHNSTPDMIVGLTPQLILLFVVYLWA